MARAGERLQPRDNWPSDSPRSRPPLGPTRPWSRRARCLYCFDAPCTRACPTEHRRPPVHPPDPPPRRDRRGPDDPRGEHLRRELRPGLPDRGPLRRGLRRPPPLKAARSRSAGSSATPATPLERGERFFEPGPPTGKRVAVVGSGPAGLSCAHELRRLGPRGRRLRGPARPRRARHLGDRRLQDLDRVRPVRDRHDPRDRHRPPARISASRPTDAPRPARRVRRRVPRRRPGPDGAAGDRGGGPGGGLGGARLHLPDPRRPFEDCEVGRHVLVIGAGNTAIDVATAARGSGPTGDDRLSPGRGGHARLRLRVRPGQGRRRPVRVVRRPAAGRRRREAGPRASSSRGSTGARRRRGDLRPIPGSEFVIPADMVVKALGQEPARSTPRSPARPGPRPGRVAVDPATGATTHPRPLRRAATASATGARSSTPSRTARSPPGGSMPTSGTS